MGKGGHPPGGLGESTHYRGFPDQSADIDISSAVGKNLFPQPASSRIPLLVLSAACPGRRDARQRGNQVSDCDEPRTSRHQLVMLDLTLS